MKKNLQFIVTGCLILLLSSCQNEEKWVDGTLDYSMTQTTDNSGYFETGGIFTYNDIDINSGYFDYINKVAFRRSVLEVTGNIIAGDVIRNMRVDVNGTGIFVVGDVYVNQDGKVTVLDSEYISGYYNFMFDSFNVMNNTGKHDIIVYGYLTNNGRAVSNARLTITFYNDLDIRVGNY